MSRNRSFAIVPAAGKSRRMGQDKLLMPWGDSTVIESLLASWRRSNVDEVVVVAKRDHAELLSLCNDVTIVTPAVDPPEMKDSVLAALEHIQQSLSPSDADVWLLAPADMPQLNADIVNQLLAAHDADEPTIIVPICDGKRGHPVLFPWSLANEVKKLRDDEGVNALLLRFPVRELECDAAEIHGDLDTQADYERLRSISDSRAKARSRKDE